MLTCIQARRLLSRSRDEKLPFVQRASLRLHLMMCRFCRNYARQLEVLSNVAHETALEPLEDVALDMEAKRRIADRLARKGSSGRREDSTP